MIFAKAQRHHTLNGILFTCLFALSSYYLASFHWVIAKGISPLVIAIVLGMLYGSTLRHHLPHEWSPGIQFVSKRILRLAIILYGFRLTFQQVAMVGLEGFVLDVLIVSLTLLFGTFAGTKLFKLDRDTSILISSGSAICGAAAVLATEGLLKSEPHKAAVAIISVVLFGTTAMFLYPFMQQAGWLNLDNIHYGIYAGATIHEVAQVLVAGTQITPNTGEIAVIVKMTRVMLLAPALIVIGLYLVRSTQDITQHKMSLNIPWFAVMFIVVVGFNSLHLLPNILVSIINHADTFLLTLAMAALGIETNFAKVKQIGLKPLYLSLFLFIWLIAGGYMLSKLVFKFI
ncbi:MAG: YeiH family protein [Gammaproteobacteria bacterium]